MPLPPHFLPDPFSVLPKAAAIEKILHAAMSPADAEVAVHTHVRVSGSVMVVGNTTYNLDEYQRVLVLGIGKASIAMARAVLNLLGSRVTEGLIVTKHADLDRIGPIKVIESSHPVPDERSLAAAQRLTSLLKSTTDNDLVVFVISGGGSALVSHPKSSISLGDLQALTRILLQSGADIREMNVLRRHLDLVKGGGLLGYGHFGQWVSLILSDVLDQSLENIASGPTAPDPTTYADALAVIRKYGLRERIPRTILNELVQGASGQVPETIKPGAQLFERVQNVIVGSNLTSAKAAYQ